MKSIKAKLIMLGAVAIICTIILGFTGIYIMNNSTVSSQVLNDINNIILRQNENTNAELSYLYDYDINCYNDIESNLSAMNDEAKDAIRYSSMQDYEEELKSISSDIEKAISNTAQLREMLEYRGFKAGDGLYDSFVSGDEEIDGYAALMSGESGWIDGAWDSADLSKGNSVSLEGKSYKRVVYNNEFPSSSKRNTLVIRIGGYGAAYSGNVYITDIKFDSTEVDLGAVSQDVLQTSYGDGLSELQLASFQGKDCIAFKGSFTDINGAWQEATINVDIRGYDCSSSKRVSCVIYFEDAQQPSFSMAVCLDGKYDLETKLALLDSSFDEYSRLVAQGEDIGSFVDDNKALMSELIAKAPLYTMDPSIGSGLTAALKAKSDAMDSIAEYDSGILALKAENKAVNESLSQSASKVREQIESMAAMQKKTMSALIYGVFAIGAVLVVLLTLFVISSVQKSIIQFKGTLGQITDGNITIKARTDNRNEFDTFGSSLNKMTDKLSEVIGDTASCATELNSTGSELEQMSRNCENISEQLELSISGIAQGASAQASDVETSTSEITHLGALMDGMNEDVRELDITAVNMKQAGDGAMGILNELNDSNDHMTDSIHKIEEQIIKTNDSVKEIEQAVSLISSIADQTNLLSLNASIEAARAGEAGRGFAVVASEIQQLADQSNNSANTVFDVISNLIKDFEEMLHIMEEVKTATKEQNEKLLQTQKQFEVVNSGITQSRDKTAIIKSAIDECNKACSSVSRIMMNLSAISEENAASTTEAADAMQHLNSTITTLLEESQKLLALSTQLGTSIEFFKLEGGQQ